MKFIALSDLHGYLPKITESANVMFICGDISPLYLQRNKIEMHEWLFTSFMQWITNLPVEKVFMIAGNHDFYFESLNKTKIDDLEKASGYKLKYLCNEDTVYVDKNGKIWTIFGTPYCKIFGNWPFMRSEDVLIEKFSKIPKEVDFILSHDTPYDVGQQDFILQTIRHSDNELEHIGNKPLKEALNKTNFKWCFHGHIHSSSHDPDKLNDGYVVNVSILDEYYKPKYNYYINEI